MIFEDDASGTVFFAIALIVMPPFIYLAWGAFQVSAIKQQPKGCENRYPRQQSE